MLLPASQLCLQQGSEPQHPNKILQHKAFIAELATKALLFFEAYPSGDPPPGLPGLSPKNPACAVLQVRFNGMAFKCLGFTFAQSELSKSYARGPETPISTSQTYALRHPSTFVAKGLNVAKVKLAEILHLDIHFGNEGLVYRIHAVCSARLFRKG